MSGRHAEEKEPGDTGRCPALAPAHGGSAPRGPFRCRTEGDPRIAARLAEAVRSVDAPDVVFAVSRQGHRTLAAGGTAPPPAGGRERLRYEIGSASKVFTGLLLARLAQGGRVRASAPAAALLSPGRPLPPDPVTLAHLVTHTSGLPRLPAGFYPQALPRWSTEPYAHYPADRLLRAFLRARPRHRPGARWRYSNFGVSVLGHALAAATATAWEDLLAAQVLRPLALDGTALRPGGPGCDATGHRADGVTATPALRTGGFAPAGAVRATPYDLLAFVEAHAMPEGSPLESALRTMHRPVLRRGAGRREVHTLSWFRHEAPGGAVCFHAGATSGQQAFLGFQPATGTALVALCTRRFRRGDALVPAAYALLADGF